MKIVSTIVTIITILITIIMVLVLALYLLGIKPTIVTSGSMTPTIPIGSICFINTKEPLTNIEKEDIIVYQIPKQKVIHRVIGIKEEGIITKGDSNEHVDSLIITEDVYYGKYLFLVPYVGYLTARLQTPLGKAIFVTLFIVLYVLDYLLLYAKKREKQNGGNQ